MTNSHRISVLQVETWSEVVTRLKNIPLLGDPVIFPYRQADISLKVVKTDDIKPLSLYLLRAQLRIQKLLHEQFHNQLGIDILNLDTTKTRIEFKLAGETENWFLIPPIVEFSAADNCYVLVDGEHRFWLAHELGLPIEVIVINHVDVRCPVVARPVSWSDVVIHDQVPPVYEKRKYRFPQLSDFPDVSGFSRVEISAQNYLYFFYRDLGKLCSSGIRN